MDTDDETEVYLHQLKEVFDSCDSFDKGYLDKDELLKLCYKLQLEEQAEAIVDYLTEDTDEAKVTFEAFKENFVEILCQSTIERVVEGDKNDSNSLNVDDDDDSEEESEEETDDEDEDDGDDEDEVIEEKIISEDNDVEGSDGNQPDLQNEISIKKYGRKSKPLSKEDFEDLNIPDIEGKANKIVKGKPPIKPKKQNEAEMKKRNEEQFSSLTDNTSDEEMEKDTFEDEGVLNLNLSELEQAQDFTTGEDYLRSIWKTNGIGRDGYIGIDELNTVCAYIGMEEMNDEQLHDLFNKLDADGDGKISFDEFIGGLFNHSNISTSSPPRAHGSTTPRANTPRTHSAQKKVKVPSGEDRSTPSIVPGSGVSGVFTTIDPENTGFAMPDTIIDFWEKHNIPNGADILMALGFDLVTKVNLSDLSLGLEQVLINADEQDAVYQAALCSCQQEIRQLKSLNEQYSWATDKLKQDLSEANARNSMLAKEVDERHAHLEQSSEKKLVDTLMLIKDTYITVERKYQEQIKSLQGQLDDEREQYSAHTSKLKSKINTEMENLKHEEGRLRENLTLAHKELEKLESDLFETTEKLAETEKQNSRFQKELEATDELQRKFDELESKGIFLPNQHSLLDRMKEMEELNKDLKDRNDELTAEMESVKHLLPSRKSKASHDWTSKIPVKDGTYLSDYIRTKRGSARSSVSDFSDDESVTGIPCHPGRVRRRLPTAPDDDDASSVCSSMQNDRDYIDVLKRELYDTRLNFDREKKEIDQAYKMEITKIEEKQDQEKADLLKKVKNDQEKMKQEINKKMLDQLAEHQKELQTEYVNEKQDLIQKYESQINLLKQQFKEEKDSIESRYQAELDGHVNKVKSEYQKDKSELETYLTGPTSAFQRMQQENSELKEQVNFMKEEMECHQQEMNEELETALANTETALRQLEKEKVELNIQLNSQREEYEQKLKEEKSSLEERFEQKLRKTEKDHMRILEEKLEEQKTYLDKSHKKLKDQLCNAYESEHEHVVQRYESDIKILKQTIEGLQNKTDEEREIIGRRFEEDREIMQEEIAREIRQELEEEIIGQMEQVKEAFDEERSKLQQQSEMYQNELEDAQREIDKNRINRKKTDEMAKTITSLQREKKLADKTIEDLQSTLNTTKMAMERRIGEIKVEKDGAISAVKTEFVQSAKQSGKDKAAYEEEINMLKKNLTDLEKENRKMLELQTSLEDMEKKCNQQQDFIHNLQGQLDAYKTKIIPPHAQSIIDELVEQREQLQDSLNSAHQKLTDVDHKIENLTKLQKKYNHNVEKNNNNTEAPEDDQPEGLQKEKEILMALKLERDRLETELENVSTKLVKANNDLAQNQTQHAEEMKKYHVSNGIDIDNFTRLQIDLVDQQRQLRELQEFIEAKENEKNKKFKVREEEMKKAIKELEEDKNSLQRKLRLTQQMLDEQIEKIKNHYGDCEKRNVLVVDLYKENSELMEALCVMEERKKDAVSRCYRMEDQCRALKMMLKKVYHVAVT
ncbi:ninein-like protein isoform X3 [Mytilus edulis]|uniref:ninein-like protein isoform X3 n=1 Tax=Mytilus edulis TaxID=6550 RepID=UPI0039F082CF